MNASLPKTYMVFISEVRGPAILHTAQFPIPSSVAESLPLVQERLSAWAETLDDMVAAAVTTDRDSAGQIVFPILVKYADASQRQFVAIVASATVS